MAAYASRFSTIAAGQTQVSCSMMQECGASGMKFAEMIALLRPMHERLNGSCKRKLDKWKLQSLCVWRLQVRQGELESSD